MDEDKKITPISDGINATFDALDSIILRKKQEAAKKSKEEALKLQEEAVNSIDETEAEQDKKAKDTEDSIKPIETAAQSVTKTVQTIEEIKETLANPSSLDEVLGVVNKIIEFITEDVTGFATAVLNFVNALVKIPIETAADAAQAGTLVIARSAQSTQLATTDWPSAEEVPQQTDTEIENT